MTVEGASPARTDAGAALAAYADYPDLAGVRRVLVIKLRHHGDVLLSTPVISTLARALPDARIDAYLNRETLPMLDGHPDVDRFHLLDRSVRKRGGIAAWREEWRLLRAIRSARYDLVVNLTDGDRGRYAAMASGAAIRVGYARRDRPVRGYTHLVKRPATPRHVVELNLDALRRIGIVPDPENIGLSLSIPDAAHQAVRTRLAAAGLVPGRFFLVHPASRWLFKCWPEANVAALVRHIALAGWPVVLTAAPDQREMEMVARIRDSVAPTSVLDLSGQLTLKELAALIDAAACLFTVDSVPLHIASALQRPVVALYGPSSEVEWGPWRNPAARVVTDDASCRPCGLDGCGGSKVSDCLTHIPVDRVLAAMAPLLAASSPIAK